MIPEVLLRGFFVVKENIQISFNEISHYLT